MTIDLDLTCQHCGKRNFTTREAPDGRLLCLRYLCQHSATPSLADYAADEPEHEMIARAYRNALLERAASRAAAACIIGHKLLPDGSCGPMVVCRDCNELVKSDWTGRQNEYGVSHKDCPARQA